MTPRARGQISATPPPVLPQQTAQTNQQFPLTTSYYPFPNVVRVGSQQSLSVVSAPAPVLQRPDIISPPAANGVALGGAVPSQTNVGISGAMLSSAVTGKAAIVIPSGNAPPIDGLNGLKTGKTGRTGNLSRVKQLHLHDQHAAVMS